MGRKRRHSREYPFIPLEFLIREFNAWCDRSQRVCWRKVAVDKAQARDLNKYDDLTGIVPSSYIDWPFVLEQRILHFEMVAHMARKSRVIPTRQSTGLPEPFGSAPLHPGKYEVRFKYANGLKQNIHIFAAEYAAWHFIQAVINGNKVRWLDAHRFQAGDVIVQSRHLQLLTEYAPTTAERAWVLPIPYSYYAWHIATGEPWNTRNAAKFNTHDDTSTSESRQTDRSSRSKASRKRDDVQNTSTGRKSRNVQSSDGTTFGITELVESTGKDASRIRAALRKSTLTKPADGWSWPVAEKDAVLAAVKKFLK